MNNYRKIPVIILALLLALAAFGQSNKRYKLIPLQSIQYTTVKKICEPMLSANGKLVYERSRNSVLIYDTPEKIAKIEKFIKGADRPPVNIKITLDRQSVSPKRDFYVGESPRRSRRYSSKYPTKVKISGGKTNIKVYNNKLPKNRYNNFTLRDRSSNTSRNVSSFIMTSSGRPASLWVGTTRVDPSWLRNSRRRPDIIITDGKTTTVIDSQPDDIKYTDVGVSLQVLPTYSDNGLIHVEIYPEISYLVGKRRKNVKVESLVTSVTVRNGHRVHIGGVMASKQEQYSQIFGRTFLSRSEVADVMNMYLTATASTPGKSYRGGSSRITNDWIPR